MQKIVNVRFILFQVDKNNIPKLD